VPNPPAGAAGVSAPSIRAMSPTAAAMMTPMLASVKPDQAFENSVAVVVLYSELLMSAS